jgi:2-polyprenyl-3-methyl-5-hydroxy-6-metoxy-1,4-benzoquinol methylase
MSKERLKTPELIDLGPTYYQKEEYIDCLNQLDRIGRFLGGEKASYRAFNRLKNPPKSILDVGCGGGLFTKRLAKRYSNAQVIGIDPSEEAIEFANHQLKISNPPIQNLQFKVSSFSQLPDSFKSFDVVTATLVCHHFSDEEIIDFLKQSYLLANKAIILNDLHRHVVSEIGFSTLSPIFFPNRLILHDGLLSIKKGFKRSDWIHYIEAAHIPLHQCSITWHWAFRWIIFINTSTHQIPL